MTYQQNKNLARIFREMAAMYRYIGEKERFRARAYEKASRVIDSLQINISSLSKKELDDLPGIGESISEKIIEYLKTGRIKKQEQLYKKVPVELIDMMDIKGFGAGTVKKIHKQLHITTKQELTEALEKNKFVSLNGFGSQKIDSMKRGLKLHKTMEKRMFLSEAMEIGNKLLEKIRKIPGVEKAELAGSLRRKKVTIGDFDILIACAERHRKKIASRLTEPGFAREVIAKGLTRVSVVLKESGKQLDVRIVNENDWGSALQYFTGSKEHNIHLRALARKKGYKISEYGIFNLADNTQIHCSTEELIYTTLGLKMMQPEMRENRGEIELAKENKLPEPVLLTDIKGDMQLHSNWSDGINGIEEIALFLRKNYNYEYMVVTDHSKSMRVAHGLDEKKLLQQLEEIKLINKKIGTDFIKTGIEVDILPDGSLDLSNDVLSQLDWVTASIHSGFSKDNTDRLIKACENPFVNCIGHATGRLIGKRDAYPLDIDKILAVAKKHTTAFEINCQPERMDLDDELARKAREKGVLMIISTDSHSLSAFDYMKYGVFIAQRAFCTQNDILNTRSWKEIELFRRNKINNAELKKTSLAQQAKIKTIQAHKISM